MSEIDINMSEKDQQTRREPRTMAVLYLCDHFSLGKKDPISNSSFFLLY